MEANLKVERKESDHGRDDVFVCCDRIDVCGSNDHVMGKEVEQSLDSPRTFFFCVSFAFSDWPFINHCYFLAKEGIKYAPHLV